LGKRVRIATQLIDADTGVHVWDERYDRSLDDIFALQDEITLSTVGAIEPSLRTAEIERVKRKRPENLDAAPIGFELSETGSRYAKLADDLCCLWRPRWRST
jgi:hypothetical protein